MTANGPFRLLMISAMYENGGNTTQRLLDGHPELQSYPFESQPGTRLVVDFLSSLYPVKYRWPVFPLDGSVEQDYELIIDEECKVRLKTPQSSKFKDWPMEMDDKERKRLFVAQMQGKPRTRANLVAAFYRASGEAWKDYRRSGKEQVHVGYSPIIGVDAGQIVKDMPEAHVLNVVRNPWSAYGDTKKRAVPLSIAHYMTGWCMHQLAALNFSAAHPQRVHILRFEDIIVDPQRVLGEFLAKLGVGPSPTLARASWNGKVLEQVYPWGTIRTPTTAANQATGDELSAQEKDEIRDRTRPLLTAFGYA
ncbi:MAG: sulfotransferase [Planctomycetota bacterium]